MLAEERYAWILARLRQNGVVKTSELCSALGISGETARRDLEKLEQEGYLRRVYGGAVSLEGRGIEPPIQSRRVRNVEEKRAIGALAASFVRDGDTVSLDVGTTTFEVARNLKGKRGLTVLTNCLFIAMELAGMPGLTVYLTGGTLRQDELALSGPLAEEGVRRFYVDKTFIGAGGLTIDEGLTDYHVAEAQVRRLMIERAREVIVVADHSKIGKVAFTSVAPLSQITRLITDDKADPHFLQELVEKGVEVHVAHTRSGRSAD